MHKLLNYFSGIRSIPNSLLPHQRKPLTLQITHPKKLSVAFFFFYMISDNFFQCLTNCSYLCQIQHFSKITWQEIKNSSKAYSSLKYKHYLVWKTKSSGNGDCIHHTLTCIYINDHEPGVALHNSSRAGASALCWHSNMAHKIFNKTHSLCFHEGGSCLYCAWKLFISLFKVKMPFSLV